MNITPKVRKFMTSVPHTIGVDIEIDKARDIMRRHNIRHLPVLEQGRLVGILSDRDVKLALSFPGPGKLSVGDVMTPDPYVVDPDTTLSEVAEEMSIHKYGCALVRSEKGGLIGIFTEVDGLRVLSQLLREREKAQAA